MLAPGSFWTPELLESLRAGNFDSAVILTAPGDSPHGLGYLCALAGIPGRPHHPEGTVPGYARECGCRKPEPGLLCRAAAELGLDLARSWMVGDILNDVEAGRRAGCRTVLLDLGGETEWVPGPYRTPHHTARVWAEVAGAILAAEGEEHALRTP